MRCFIQPGKWADPTVVLDAEESHHALGVLKAREGQAIDVFNGCGGKGRATISAIRKNTVTLAIDRRTADEPRTPSITLIQAVPREQKMDFAIQKAVELEASAIAPVITEHCVVRLKPAQAEERLERWQKIALNAGKQSGCAWLPRIAPVVDLDRYLAARPAFDLLLVGALTGQMRPFKGRCGACRPGRKPSGYSSARKAISVRASSRPSCPPAPSRSPSGPTSSVSKPPPSTPSASCAMNSVDADFILASPRLSYYSAPGSFET